MPTIASPRASSPPTSLSATIARIASPSISTTATSTPSSFVRPSLDLPTTQPSTAQRRRAALRDYYNLKSRTDDPSASSDALSSTTPRLTRALSITSTTSTSTVTTTHPNDLSTPTASRISTSTLLPASIDDTAFDAESYVQNLLKNSNLRDILRTESALVSEIRNLDGERKALVYDNYSKLIVAVGTLGGMRRGVAAGGRVGSGNNARDKGNGDGVDGLEEKMKGLIELVKGMSGRDESDGTRGDSVKTGTEAREMRKNKALVRWVLAAPSRLRRLMQEEEREEAQRDWDRVRQVLGKWEGVKGVAEVERQCEEIMISETNAERYEGEEARNGDAGELSGED